MKTKFENLKAGQEFVYNTQKRIKVYLVGKPYYMHFDKENARYGHLDFMDDDLEVEVSYRFSQLKVGDKFRCPEHVGDYSLLMKIERTSSHNAVTIDSSKDERTFDGELHFIGDHREVESVYY